MAHPTLHAWLQERLSAHATQAGGGSHRVARLVMEGEAPSLDNGELTDKGAASARAVLARRIAVVEELHRSPPSTRTIVA